MRHQIFNIPIDDLSERELEAKIASSLDHGRLFIVTPNPEMILHSRKNSALSEALMSADLLLADGVGIRFALAALGDTRLQNRMTGVDTLQNLARVCEKKKKRLLLLGGTSGSGEVAVKKIRIMFPNLEVETFNPGKIKDSDFEEVAKKVREFKIDALAVALGQGKQEVFLHHYLGGTGARIGIGVGGAFEMIAGKLSRAPLPIRLMGFEWLWRLWLEPKRIGRISRAVIVFPATVAYTTWRENRFFSACKNVSIEIIRHFRSL